MPSRLLQSVSQLLSRMATAVQKSDSAEVLSCRGGMNHRHPEQLGRMRERRIHLTFDDGPHPTNTPKVLEELKRAGIQATFFVTGKHLETSLGQELIHRAAAEGHQIGNHTYSHPRLTELTEDQIRQEILRTEQLIGDVNQGIKILRPPYGAHNPMVDQVAQELDYRLVLWNVDSCDWDPKYQDRWVEHAMKQIMTHEQSVVLAHDNQTTTVTRVEALIVQIQNLPGSSFIRHSEAFP
jgi:peptidoglycan/xylan/chitin deacetylase (PgdA/CDA1 family)